MKNYSIKALREALDTKEVSSVEVLEHFKTEIETHDQKINSFITKTYDHALAQAQKADEAIAKGEQKMLTGIPIAHKDLFCTKGIKTTAASKMLENFVSPYDATVVEKLDQAGVMVLGKVNMDEFAMGGSNRTSHFGTVHNPWNCDHVAGGSSGGSAAAVSAGFVLAATASDTGGSTRQPASFCNLTGIKATYGRISRWGMIPFACSFDQAGVIAKTAEDCAYMFEAMAGHDAKDSTSHHVAVPKYSNLLNQSIEGLRIGIPKEFLSKDLDPKIAAVIENALKQYEAMGATLVEVTLPNTDVVVPVYYTIAPAEASSNLACFDGVRYGHRCENPQDLQDLYMRSRAEGFGEEVKKRIFMGTYALSASAYDAYYVKAQKVRRLVANDYNSVLSQVDVIMGPTSPDLPFRQDSKGGTNEYLSDIFTVGANLAGLPAMSIPAGFVEGLPVGLQIIGRAFDEGKILNVAHAYQKETDWHTKLPTLD